MSAPEKLLTIGVTTYSRPEACKTLVSSIIEGRRGLDALVELVIVNDNPQSGHYQLLERFVVQAAVTTPVRYVSHLVNRGLGSSRNCIINNSLGRYIWFVDDDDSIFPGMIGTVVGRLLRCNPEEEVLFFHNFSNTEVKTNHRISNLFLMGVTPPVSSQIFGKRLLVKVSGYDEEIMSGVDHGIWVRLLASDPLVAIVPLAIIKANTNPYDNRITTDVASRSDEIARSLRKWKPIICKNISAEFFYHFSKNYRAYLRKSGQEQAMKRLPLGFFLIRMFRMGLKLIKVVKREPGKFTPF